MPAWEITRKDLLLLARDRRAAFVLVAFPMIFIAILGVSMGKLIDRLDADRSVAGAEAAGEKPGSSDNRVSEPSRNLAFRKTRFQEETVEKSDVYRKLVPGFTVMFVFFLVNIMARSFIHERQLGTLGRLRMAPVSPSAILIGKTAPFFIVSLIQTAVLFAAGRFLWGMPWGTKPWLLLPVMGATSLAATSLGLLVATLVRTDAQVSAYANVVVITMAGISGCFLPREWLPETIQQISLATPHAWAVIAYDEILSQPVPGLGKVLEACGVLLGFSLLYFLLGCGRFGRVD